MVLHPQMSLFCISNGFTAILHRAQQSLTTYPPTMPNMAFKKKSILCVFQEFQCFQADTISRTVKNQCVFIICFEMYEDL